MTSDRRADTTSAPDTFAVRCPSCDVAVPAEAVGSYDVRDDAYETTQPGLSQEDLDGPCESRFYPERTTFIAEGARRALFEQDTILKKLRELEQARAEVLPFD